MIIDLTRNHGKVFLQTRQYDQIDAKVDHNWICSIIGSFITQLLISQSKASDCHTSRPVSDLRGLRSCQ